MMSLDLFSSVLLIRSQEVNPIKIDTKQKRYLKRFMMRLVETFHANLL